MRQNELLSIEHCLKTLKNWRDCKSDDRGFVEQKKMSCKDRGRRSQPLESVCCKYHTDVKKDKHKDSHEDNHKYKNS